MLHIAVMADNDFEPNDGQIAAFRIGVVTRALSDCKVQPFAGAISGGMFDPDNKGVTQFCLFGRCVFSQWGWSSLFGGGWVSMEGRREFNVFWE